MLKNKDINKPKESLNLSSKQINKLRNIDEYRKNETQINIIKKVLTEHCDVSESVVNSLINAVKENTIIECNKN